jgi:hypothetical protein
LGIRSAEAPAKQFVSLDGQAARIGDKDKAGPIIGIEVDPR